MLVKRLSASLLALTLILGAGAPTVDNVLFEDNILVSAVSDEDGELISGDYKYTILDDGTAEITAFSGNDENVEIPQELDGKTVVSIAKNAFANCNNIKSVKMPDTITKIGGGAFSGCEKLENIELSKNLNRISGTIDVTYGDGGAGAFSNCTSLKSIVIPNSCTEIGNSTFAGCTNLTSVTLPDNEHCVLDGWAFFNCFALKEVYLPKGIEFYIDGYFSDYSPVGPMVNYSYEENKSVIDTVYTVASDNPYTGIQDGIIFDKKNGHIIAIYPDVKTLKVPSGIKEFGEYGYCAVTTYVDQIEEIVLPDTATKIVDDISRLFDSLKKITIPKSVNKIDDGTLGFKYDDNYNLVVNKNFVIRCYKNSAAYDYAVKNNIKYELIDADNKTPGNVIAQKYTSTTNAVRINWNKVSGASGYRVYKYNTSTKKWDKVKDVSADTLTYKFTGLKAGTTYKYKVKAYTKSGGQTVWGNASSTITTATKPAKPAITKASKSASAVRLYWNKVSGASGYKLQQYDNASKKWKTVKLISASSTNYKVTGLKSNTAYKFRLQAYKSAGGQKTYSAWSATKKATTKK